MKSPAGLGTEGWVLVGSAINIRVCIQNSYKKDRPWPKVGKLVGR